MLRNVYLAIGIHCFLKNICSIIAPDLLVLVGFMGNGNLFCSSVNLHESLMNPTPYCVVSGKLLALVSIDVFKLMFV